MQIWNKKDQNRNLIDGDLDLSLSDDESDNETDNETDNESEFIQI